MFNYCYIYMGVDIYPLIYMLSKGVHNYVFFIIAIYTYIHISTLFESKYSVYVHIDSNIKIFLQYDIFSSYSITMYYKII